MRPAEEPVTVRANGDRVHPAWGLISASRVSGFARLFLSEFTHHNYVSVSIHRARLVASDHGDDYPMDEREVIEIAMSEAQWAAFVSTPNRGVGIPCTITDLDQKPIPSFPPPPPRHAVNRENFKRKAAEATADLDFAITALRNYREAKLRPTLAEMDQLIDKFTRGSRILTDSIPYLLELHAEAAEKTVAAAKTEIQGWLLGQIRALGVDPAAVPPLALSDGSDA